jgi:preprotein translocase subunit SecE
MMVDKIKIAVAIALLAAGITAFYYWSESLMIIRVVAVLAGAAAGVVVFWTSAPGKTFFAFARESSEETRRVVWPTRKETMQTTGVVFAFVAVMAVFLWMMDIWIARALSLLMGWGQ